MARPKHNQKVYDKLKMISENQTRSKSKVTQNDARNVEMTTKISITKIYIYIPATKQKLLSLREATKYEKHRIAQTALHANERSSNAN